MVFKVWDIMYTRVNDVISGWQDNICYIACEKSPNTQFHCSQVYPGKFLDLGSAQICSVDSAALTSPQSYILHAHVSLELFA